MEYSEITEFIETRLAGVFQHGVLNQYNTRPLRLSPTEENAKIFNEISEFVHKSDLNILERTKSGAIRKGPKYLKNFYAYDVVKSSLGLTLTISLDGYLRVIKFGLYKKEEAPDVYPVVAFARMKEVLLDTGVDLEDYAIDNGHEVRAATPPAPIKMYQYHTEKSRPLTNVHHLDFHSSYPAGLANTHPEFRPAMEYFYKLRKIDPVAKFIMNSGIGYLCTEKNGFRARFAHLRKDAVEDNNRRIDELTMRLLMSGRLIIGHNTDGIWYQGDIYHGDGEGPGLGEWENDHVNCLFRAKSDGAYEFIENGVYHPVVRGQTTLEAVKPREQWEFGDIYKTGVKAWKFDDKKGVIYFNEI